MFLAAGPYFQRRFSTDDRILATFQSSELAVSTVANLGSMILLTKLQARASYPRRIMLSLIINSVTFTMLAVSTKKFTDVTASGYFSFLIIMVFVTSLATGLMQNGIFAFSAGMGREEYTQAIMTGQGIAGVLPCIVQIVSVLSIPAKDARNGAADESSTSALSYFLTATGISVVTFAAFLILLVRHTKDKAAKQSVAAEEVVENNEDMPAERPSVPLITLFKKLFWLAGAVFLTFGITMFFPVFTQEIESVHPENSAPRLLQKASFVPLALLFWNAGDLIGRLLTAIPALSLTSRPRVLFLISVARIIFIPLYLLCNINGHGAVIVSDAFYLVIVQLLFGISNGYVGSLCMMGAAEWVEPEEREAAGSFMGLCLVSGLTVGSLLSFFASGSRIG